MIALDELFHCNCIMRKIYFANLERALYVLAEVRLANIELEDYCHTPIGTCVQKHSNSNKHWFKISELNRNSNSGTLNSVTVT